MANTGASTSNGPERLPPPFPHTALYIYDCQLSCQKKLGCPEPWAVLTVTGSYNDAATGHALSDPLSKHFSLAIA